MAGSAGIRGLAVVNPSSFQWRNAIEDELIRLSQSTLWLGIVRSTNETTPDSPTSTGDGALLTLPQGFES